VAGARNVPVETKNEAQKSTAEGEFICSECGRGFGRPAALGAHRSRAHGIAGISPQALRNHARRRKTSGGPRAHRPAQTWWPQPSDSSTIDYDQLLQVIFPNGMPAREEVIRAVSTWLADAERIAQLG
jgi:hypothetical protein